MAKKTNYMNCWLYAAICAAMLFPIGGTALQAQSQSNFPGPTYNESVNSFEGQMIDLPNGIIGGIAGGGPVNWDVRVYKGDFDAGGLANDLLISMQHLVPAAAPGPVIYGGIDNVVPGSPGIRSFVTCSPVPHGVGDGIGFDSMVFNYSQLLQPPLTPSSIIGITAQHLPACPIVPNNMLPFGLPLVMPENMQSWPNVPEPGTCAIMILYGLWMIRSRRPSLAGSVG